MITDAAYLAVRHGLAHWGRSLIIAACAAVAVALPLASRAVTGQLSDRLEQRAASVPMVVGAAGSRFDLMFNALFHRAAGVDPVPVGLADELRADGLVQWAIPVSRRFEARGLPVVATVHEYAALRGLRLERGRTLALAGETILGASAARRLGLGPGDAIFTQPRALYDITAPPVLKLAIVGIYAPTGTADDDATFVDLATSWILEGDAHGHDDAREIAGADVPAEAPMVLARSDRSIRLSESLVPYQEVTRDNAAAFHVHGSTDDLPVTAVLVEPADEKSATILSARLSSRPGIQVIRPDAVARELVGYLLDARAVTDAVGAVVGASTLVMIALIVALGLRARSEELRMLSEIGCSRPRLAAVLGLELAMVLAAGVAGALALAAIAAAAAAQLA